MCIRFVTAVAVLMVPSLAALSACTDDTKSAPAFPPAFEAGAIAQPPAVEGGAVDATPDADTPDADTPDASAADATKEADAAVTTVHPFATGLGANGMPLSDGSIDPHWTVQDGAANALTAYVQTDALGFAGYWMAPSATSKFISPFADTVDPSGNGTFTYTTTFSLRAGVDAGAVALVVRYASDNQMTSVALNGQPIAGVVAGSYSTFQTLNVTGPFIEGVNTIAFAVSNYGGPTGVRVEMDLTAN